MSLLELSEHVDSGDIVGQATINFDGTELYDDIRKKQANATYELILKFLEKYRRLKKPNLEEALFIGKEDRVTQN